MHRTVNEAHARDGAKGVGGCLVTYLAARVDDSAEAGLSVADRRKGPVFVPSVALQLDELSDARRGFPPSFETEAFHQHDRRIGRPGINVLIADLTLQAREAIGQCGRIKKVGVRDHLSAGVSVRHIMPLQTTTVEDIARIYRKKKSLYII